MKKFEIGLSPYISKDEYDIIFQQYAPYIDYVYYSVPLGSKFQTRKKLYANMSFEEASCYSIGVFSVIEKHNIHTELCFNSQRLEREDIQNTLIYVRDILGHMPEAVVSLREYAKFVTEYFPKTHLMYSFNNGIRNKADISLIPSIYKEIIIIPQMLQDKEMWNELQLTDFDIRVLLNNGCSPNCMTCRKPEFCEDIFNANITKYGVEYMYAHQSLFPSEFKQFIENEPCISAFKISNRTSDFRYLYNCLNGYVNGVDFENKTVSLYNWCRLGYFGQYYKNHQIDIDTVYELKKKRWGDDYTIAITN